MNKGFVSGVCRDCGKRTFFRRKVLDRVKGPRCAQCGGYLDVVPHVAKEHAVALQVRDTGVGAALADTSNVAARRASKLKEKFLARPKLDRICSFCGHALSMFRWAAGERRCAVCTEKHGRVK